MAKKKDNIPDYFINEDEAGNFWDSHSVSDYWQEMEAVDMGFDIKEKIHLVSINDSIYKIIKQKARDQHKSVEVLINSIIKKAVT